LNYIIVFAWIKLHIFSMSYALESKLHERKILQLQYNTITIQANKKEYQISSPE